MPISLRFAIRAAAIGAALLSLQVQAKDHFLLVDLSPNAGAAGATDINNAGQVAGYRYMSGWITANGAMWHNGTETILAPDFGKALAISGNGNIAGNWNVNEQDLGYRFAATYINGVSTTLPSMVTSSGNVFSTAAGINNAGRVALTSATGPAVYGNEAPPEWHAAVYDHGKVTDLGTLGGNYSYVTDMNEGGTIVGSSKRADGIYRGFIYDDAGGMRDIGTLGGNTSFATAINDKGAVVGTSTDAAGISHAFLYENGVMTDLGAGTPTDINNLGQVTIVTRVNRKYTSYLYSGGVRYDLSTMVEGDEGYTDFQASAINDHGQIVGSATPSGHWESAILLNPLAPVPEPGTWGMMLAGLGVLGCALRRRA